MHPTKILAFILLGAIALAPIPYIALAPDPVPVYLGPQEAAARATPNHDATPNHAPNLAEITQSTKVDPLPVAALAMPDAGVPAADSMSSFALDPVALRADPEPGTASAPVLVAADTMLYARDNARLRASPSTAAGILAKLTANAPLHANARSSDGAWWRVSLVNGQTGYVHRAAVTRQRMMQPDPAVTAAPVVAVAPTQPAASRRSQGLRGYVDETMNWLVDTAARGSPPTVIRTER